LGRIDNLVHPRGVREVYNTKKMTRELKQPLSWPPITLLTDNPDQASVGQAHGILLRPHPTPYSESHVLPIYPDEFVSPQWRQMAAVKRWSNYGLESDTGDMNDFVHPYRQEYIAIEALKHDAEALGLSLLEQDILIAVNPLHDLGELKVGDVTLDLKNANRRELEVAETRAIFDTIEANRFMGTFQKAALKEMYAKVTTDLSAEDTARLLNTHISVFDEDINWPLLKKLFNLYERYGYTITGLQVYPYSPDVTAEDLSPETVDRLRSWNRPELEANLKSDQPVDVETRRAILTKNVLGNNWAKIQGAMEEGIPSAAAFFKNIYTDSLVKSANELMNLGLDLSSPLP